MKTPPVSVATESSTAPDAPPSSSPQGSSLGGEVLAGIIGLGIALACVLPPVVHLLTGPLGPFFGGFVAASRAKPGPRGRAIIAVMIGTGVAGILGIGAKVFAHVAGPSELPQWFPSDGTLLAILSGIWLYGTVVSGIGTAVGGALARKTSKDVASRE